MHKMEKKIHLKYLPLTKKIFKFSISEGLGAISAGAWRGKFEENFEIQITHRWSAQRVNTRCQEHSLGLLDNLRHQEH